MPERIITSGPARRGGGQRRPVRAAQPPAESANRRALRQRLGLSGNVSDADLVAATLAAIPPRASAPPPAPVPVPPPAPAPWTVGTTGQTVEQLRAEASWEQQTARLFGLEPGPATRALAAAGIPTAEEQARSERIAAEQREIETFHRNAEAHRLADVARIDAARNARIAASDAGREAAQRAQERAHWPELP